MNADKNPLKTIIILISILFFFGFTIYSVLAEDVRVDFRGETEQVNNSKVYLRADKFITGSGFSYGEFLSKQYAGGIHLGFIYNGDYGVKLLQLDYGNKHNVTRSVSYECLNDLVLDEVNKDFTCSDSGNYSFSHDYDTVNGQVLTWGEVETKDWQTISKVPSEFSGFDILGHDTAKVFSGLNIEADRLYSFRTYWHMPFLSNGKSMEEVYPNFSGKYSIVIFPDTYPLTKQGIRDAYLNGHLLILDPEYSFTNANTVHYEDAETGRATDNNWTSGNYTTAQAFGGSKSFELDASGSRTKWTNNASLDALSFPVRLQYKWRITSTSGAGYSGFGNRTNARWDNAMHFEGGDVYWSVNGTGTGTPSQDSGVNYVINTWYDARHTYYNDSWVELMFAGQIVYNGTVTTTIDSNDDGLVDYEIAFDSDSGNSIFIDNINVSVFENFPVMNSVVVSDIGSSKIKIEANATSDFVNITSWHYEVFRDNTSLATNSVSGNWLSNVLVNIANYTRDAVTGAYRVQVMAENENGNSSWLNSSALSINVSPTVQINLSRNVKEQTDAWVNITVIDPDNATGLSYRVEWFVNASNILNQSGTVNNATTIRLTLTEENFTVANQTLYAIAYADDGPNPEAQNTSLTEEIDYDNPLVIAFVQDSTTVTTGSGPRQFNLTCDYESRSAGVNQLQYTTPAPSTENKTMYLRDSLYQANVSIFSVDGTYTFKAFCVDNSGNTTITSSSLTVTASATPPPPSGTGGSGGSGSSSDSCSLILTQPGGTNPKSSSFCFAGGKSNPIPITIFNPLTTPTKYSFSVPESTCIVEGLEQTVEGTSEAKYSLEDCECPTDESLEFTVVVSCEEGSTASFDVELKPSKIAFIGDPLIVLLAGGIILGLIILLGIVFYQINK